MIVLCVGPLQQKSNSKDLEEILSQPYVTYINQRQKNRFETKKLIRQQPLCNSSRSDFELNVMNDASEASIIPGPEGGRAPVTPLIFTHSFWDQVSPPRNHY